MRSIAKQIAATVGEVETSIVIGGGNFFRGAELSQAGMDRSRARLHGYARYRDELLALQDFLEQEGIDTRVQSAITMPQVAETSHSSPRDPPHAEGPRRDFRCWCGSALYFSTDLWRPSAPWKSHADEVLVAKNGVDGIYTADPNKDPNAERLYNLTYDEAMQRNIRVLDQTAFSLCRDNNVTMRVFGMQG